MIGVRLLRCIYVFVAATYGIILQLRNATIQHDSSARRSDHDRSIVIVKVGLNVRPVTRTARGRDRARKSGLGGRPGLHFDLVAEVGWNATKSHLHICAFKMFRIGIVVYVKCDQQCDQMRLLFVQYLAIYNNVNFLKSTQNLPK